ncbi:MAG: hypothetical protein ABSA11_11040 [Candidatus Bathyarchaeia archaeon]|jgi:hypothetical protein
MNGKIVIIGVVVALFLLPAIPSALAAGTITIEASSKYYKPGDSVTLSGSTSANTQVYVSVNDTQGIVFPVTKVTADSTGKYTTSFILASDAYIGVYNAGANDGSNKATTYFTVSDITPTDLANNMIKLAQDSQARTEKLFAELKAQGVTLLPAAQKAYDKGVAALGNATTLLSKGHPWEALVAARVSMIHFRDAIWAAWGSAKVGKVETQTADSVNATIQRGDNVVEKLNATIIKLAADGKDVTVAKADLKDAETQLAAATASVKANDLVNAGKQVDAAKADLQKVIDDLKPISATLAHEGMLKFLNGAEARVDVLEAKLKALKNVNNAGKVDAAMARLELAKAKISQAQTDLTNGKDLAALGALGEARRNVNIGIGNVEAGGASGSLGKINQLEAKIQFLQRTEDQMKKWGMDTKAIQSQIDALQAQLTQAQQTTTP